MAERKVELSIGMVTETQTAKLSAGQIVPLFRLPAINRHEQFGPGDYKQHRNLVLIFFRSAECRRCRQLLREIAARYGEYEQMETEVLVIAADEVGRLSQLAQDLALPFPVLTDSDGKVTDLYLNQTEQAAKAAALEAAVFVADRWGAIFTRASAGEDQDMPAEAEIRAWLEFIELQCEECFPSEWPL
jgi:peroxiredoxin